MEYGESGEFIEDEEEEEYIKERTRDPEMYTIIILVDARQGEDKWAVDEVSELDLKVMEPLLVEIKKNGGYYPTEGRNQPGAPNARDLYHGYEGWNVLDSIVPRPLSGFTRIIEIRLFRGESMVLSPSNPYR